jgi:3',5'-cyclic AMP phosphodiesterase CpdA
MNEFKYAKALLQQIAKPLIVLPGPQDTKPLGFELFPDFIGDMSPRFETEIVKFYGFNSCILDESEGRLGRENSRIISQELASTEKISIVSFHHTIIPLPRTKHEAELIDAGDVLSVLINNNINLVLTGAKNKPATWQVDNTIFINSGTLSSYDVNSKEGNSFNVISIYNTPKGFYYEVDEVFLNTERAHRLGTYHIRKKDSIKLIENEPEIEKNTIKPQIKVKKKKAAK